tara:strand:- start:1108 stop:1380 length:273 start_codon:yes stop_codon:yes gene_type:complete
MFNFGIKRGFNNNSGLLYTKQGKTLLGNNVELPLFYNSKPYYENKLNTKTFLLFSRDGLHFKSNGVKRLKLPKDVVQEGGTETNSDFQTI